LKSVGILLSLNTEDSINAVYISDISQYVASIMHERGEKM